MTTPTCSPLLASAFSCIAQLRKRPARPAAGSPLTASSDFTMRRASRAFATAGFSSHARAFFTLLILSVTLVGCARGQGPRAAQMSQELQRRFASADRNGDGRLDREEAKTGMPWVHGNFDVIDTARAGSVSMDQVQQHARSQARRRQRPGAEMPL